MVANQIAALMNAALAADPDAINALVATRVPCNKALAEHPTIQVGIGDTGSGIGQTVGLTVGMVGLLNGVAGLARRVVVVYDTDMKRIVRFEAQDFMRNSASLV